MAGDHYVYDKSDEDIQVITKNMPRIKTVLEEDLDKFFKKNNYKSYAMAREDGSWASWWSSGHEDQKSADKSALDGCEKERVERYVKGACKVITRGEKIDIQSIK